MDREKVELIREIRKRLRRPVQSICITFLLSAFVYPMIVTVMFYIFNIPLQISLLLIIITPSIVIGYLILISIQKIGDRRAIKNLDDNATLRLLRELPTANFEKTAKWIVTSENMIGLEINIFIIPISDIVWISKSSSGMYMVAMDSIMHVVTKKGKKYRFSSNYAQCYNIDAKFDAIIRCLRVKNPKIMLL